MVVETATFRLAPGVDEEVAVAADHDVQVDFANHQPGMLRRTTARAADGEWLVVTLWATGDDAAAAAVAGAAHPAVATLQGLLEEPPAVRRYEDLGG